MCAKQNSMNTKPSKNLPRFSTGLTGPSGEKSKKQGSTGQSTPSGQFEIEGFKISDFILCQDCEEFIDYWKYAELGDVGHEGHALRNVTRKELKECAEDCKKKTDHCDELSCPQWGFIVDSPGDREFHKGHKLLQESCLDEQFVFGPYKHPPLGVQLPTEGESQE